MDIEPTSAKGDSPLSEARIRILFDDDCASAVRFPNGQFAVAWTGNCPATSVRDALRAARRAGAKDVLKRWVDAESGTQHFILA